MRAYLYRLAIFCSAIAALAGTGHARLSVREITANSTVAQSGGGFSRASTGAVARATSRPTPSAAAPAPVPPSLTDNGVRKSAGLTSDLDELYRVELIARAGGQAITRQTAQELPPNLKAAADRHTLAIDDSGRVQVFAYTTDNADSVATALTAAGMDVQRVSVEYGIVQGMIPIVNLERAAAIAGVGTIAPPQRPELAAGAQMTQGDTILNADVLRSTYGVDGTGVKVGVLSDGAEGMAASIASGDLPSVVDTTTCDVIASAPAGEPANATDPGAGAEGTAMAEIVHDLAPGAQIMIGYFGFNVSTSTTLDFLAAVTCLDEQNDVVVDDVGFFNAGLYDGTSSVSQNTANGLADAANPVRAYFTANGNSAGNHYEEGYVYSGSTMLGAGTNFWQMHRFHSTANTTDAGYGILCSATPGIFCGDEVFLAPGGVLIVNLQWNDTWGNSTNDYDLLLVDETAGTISLESANTQNGAGSNPVEDFVISNAHPGNAAFDIVIGNYKGLAAAKTFDMFVRCIACAIYPNAADHNFNTRRSSVGNQADAGGDVMAIGAIDQADPGNDTIESFSSLGPTNDGRTKPDASAIDGVNVTGNGGFGSPFYGTSAAAPHAAGVAALMLSCSPTLKAGEPGDNPAGDRTTLRNAMLSTALDLGTAGADNTFGSGRLRAALAGAAAGCSTSIDTDGDGCANPKEFLLVPPTDPNNPWDFFSVPVPALFVAPSPTTTFRDATVSAGDAQAVFGYFKVAAKTGSPEYEQDLNLNGIKDGVEYDRSVIVGSPGASGPPNGTISAADAQLAFAQFKRAYKC